VVTLGENNTFVINDRKKGLKARRGVKTQQSISITLPASS